MREMSRRERNKTEREARILDAAMTLFSVNGYSGTSMDDIAKQSGLSKPTLYQYFPSKDLLFTAMMTAPRDFMMLAFDTQNDADMVEQMYGFAWSYARTVMRPEFLSLARLIIGEAQRFPDIGRDYQASGPNKVLEGIMAFMTAQRHAGRLRFEDAELAGEDFWGLILSAPRNRALHVPDADVSVASLERYVNNGIRVFLRAYSNQPRVDLSRLDELIELNREANVNS